MIDTSMTMQDFCDLILESWGTFRDHEIAIRGINSQFRHLRSDELENLWYFLRDKADQIRIPTVTNIKKAAKENGFQIRRPSAGKIISRYVCGACGNENRMAATHCESKDCKHDLSRLPTQCLCGYVYPQGFYGRCPKCKQARVSGWVKRIVD